MIKLKKCDIINNVETPLEGYVILGVDEYGKLVLKDEYGNTENVVQDILTGTFNELNVDYLTIGDRNTATIKGNNSFSQGVSNTASGDSSTAIGLYANSEEYLSYAHGQYVNADNQFAYVYGKGINSSIQLCSSGINSFVHSYILGTVEYGAFADYSAILGGSNHMILSGSTNSVIIGGKNNTINTSVINSAIIAVSGITAVISDTLYTGHVNAINYIVRGYETSGSTYFLKADGSLDSNIYLTDNNFTGQHRTVPTNQVDFNNIDEMVGLIVISDGTYDNIIDNDNPTIDESLPNISLANKTKDKKVFGVISKKEKIDEQSRIVINSIGEGAIMVCNFNGNIENGDYITSCEIPGFGVKQDDDLLHNYTVAKITQDCDFSDATKYMEFTFNGKTYKKQFVGCTYHCG